MVSEMNDASMSRNMSMTAGSLPLGASTPGQSLKAEARALDFHYGEVQALRSVSMPIWEHKAHLVRPALADTDGPFMKYRKWYAQFYVEEPSAETPVSVERTVFPPPYWPDKMDEVPGKATASVKHGGSAL